MVFRRNHLNTFFGGLLLTKAFSCYQSFHGLFSFISNNSMIEMVTGWHDKFKIETNAKWPQSLKSWTDTHSCTARAYKCFSRVCLLFCYEFNSNWILLHRRRSKNSFYVLFLYESAKYYFILISKKALTFVRVRDVYFKPKFFSAKQNFQLILQVAF